MMMVKMRCKLYRQEDKRKSNKTNATNPASTEWKPRLSNSRPDMHAMTSFSRCRITPERWKWWQKSSTPHRTLTRLPKTWERWWEDCFEITKAAPRRRWDDKNNVTNPTSTEWRLWCRPDMLRVSIDPKSNGEDEKESREAQSPALNPQLRFPHFAGDCDGTKRWYQTSSASTGKNHVDRRTGAKHWYASNY